MCHAWLTYSSTIVNTLYCVSYCLVWLPRNLRIAFTFGLSPIFFEYPSNLTGSLLIYYAELVRLDWLFPRPEDNWVLSMVSSTSSRWGFTLVLSSTWTCGEILPLRMRSDPIYRPMFPLSSVPVQATFTKKKTKVIPCTKFFVSKNKTPPSNAATFIINNTLC